MRLLKILAWILFFPFMLSYWAWKNGKKPVMVVGIVLSALFIQAGVFGTDRGYTNNEPVPAEIVENESEPESIDKSEGELEAEADDGNTGELQEDSTEEFAAAAEHEEAPESTEAENASEEKTEPVKTVANSGDTAENELFEGYRVLVVDGGDQSGDRESDVVVDIGFGDREYYAFTNEYGQLVKVVADEIILQDEANEDVLSTGRYYSDEAKVPGVESSVLDEGHIIADSLGGVANAYNITPQNSTLNRHGDQAYMEDQIRKAGGCTDFIAIITYPDTETQIPSHYSFTYTLNGNVIHDEFDNVNSDEVNAGLAEREESGDTTESSETSEAAETDADESVDADPSSSIRIKEVDKKAEYVIIENMGDKDVDLNGWKILSVLGSQEYGFPEFILKANSQVMVGGYNSINEVDLVWEEGRGIWNNSKSDPAELYDCMGTLKSRYDD